MSNGREQAERHLEEGRRLAREAAEMHPDDRRPWYACAAPGGPWTVSHCPHRAGTLEGYRGGLRYRCDECGMTMPIYSGWRGWLWWLTGGWLMRKHGDAQ